MESPTKIVFIMAHGASGTTILGNALGELDGFFHAGELRTLWGEGLAGKHTCGCGEPFLACPVWGEVLREGFGAALSADDIATFAHWHRQTIRVRTTPRLLRMRPGKLDEWPALAAYADVAARLDRAIARVTGARVIVDSSKRTGDAALLRLLPGVDPYILHVVRDPRAVAYSWSHRSGEAPGPYASAAEWTAFGIVGEAVKWKYGRERTMVLRHEDFVERPRDAIRRVATFVAEPDTPSPLIGDRTIDFGANHTVAGHWTRFNRGRVDLRLATEWRAKQDPAERALVTAMTLPLLPRYRYPFRPRSK
jgi:hypothetical protein